MQTHTDRRSPSQVKVGHRGGAEQGKVQVLTRLFHAHPLLDIIMNPAETECLGCIYIGPLARILGSDGVGGEYLSDNTAYVSF